jgi:hypothetical protein
MSVNKNSLKELNRLLDDYLLQGKTIKTFNTPLETIRELEYIREGLKTRGTADTINQTAYEICLYCGLKTQIKGIGWTIFNKAMLA